MTPAAAIPAPVRRVLRGLVIRRAVEAAKGFGKEPNEWIRLPSTAEYVAAIAEANPGNSRNWIARPSSPSCSAVATSLH